MLKLIKKNSNLSISTIWITIQHTHSLILCHLVPYCLSTQIIKMLKDKYSTSIQMHLVVVIVQGVQIQSNETIFIHRINFIMKL